LDAFLFCPLAFAQGLGFGLGATGTGGRAGGTQGRMLGMLATEKHAPGICT